jgi:SAM-dependent methyltransferase
MLIEYHRTMLADKPRLAAFHAALKKTVVKGKSVVADIGAGTGVLGFLASKLGAKHVYLFEQAGVSELAEALAKDNDIKNVTFFGEHSTNVDGIEKVDVIVSETLGNYALEEQIIQTVEDAKRFLKPNGMIIPQRIVHFVTPVVTDRFYKELCVWDKVGYGLDFGRAKAMSLNNIFVRRFKKADLLGKPQIWDDVDLTRKNATTRKGTAEWIMPKSATIYGFAVWWDCELIEGIHLSTAPDAPKTHWEQLYFPVSTSVKLKKGEKLSIALTATSSYEAGTNLRWEITAGKERQILDLDEGFIG